MEPSVNLQLVLDNVAFVTDLALDWSLGTSTANVDNTYIADKSPMANLELYRREALVEKECNGVTLKVLNILAAHWAASV